MTLPTEVKKPYLQHIEQADGIRKNDVVKHLEMIQAVVARMANHAFLLKGWSVTLVAALLALAVNKVAGQTAQVNFAWVAVLPTLGFWFLDAYFLYQEKRFRRLYDHVRLADAMQLEALTPFCMDVNKARDIAEAGTYGGAIWSRTLLPFYGTILALVISVGFVLGAR